jgi:hypothetical protein
MIILSSSSLLTLGGIIYIDEAGQIAMNNSLNAVGVVHRLIKISEDHRNCLTIMLSGYKSQIEKLMQIDAGMSSRFPKEFDFPDYTAEELSLIFRQLLSSHNPPLQLESDSMADVLGRRLYRNAGQEGFANARSVRNIFQSILGRNFERRKKLQQAEGGPMPPLNPITDCDVLGERPDPETLSAFRELEDMIGLHRVKSSIRELLLKLQVIWDNEKCYRVPPQIPFLNRVFVGNPGTGKQLLRCHIIVVILLCFCRENHCGEALCEVVE